MHDAIAALTPALPLLSIVGTVGVIGASLALGIRHGIDWDHIAAITDITSTAAGARDADERWLVNEPGMMLTDESHHGSAHAERFSFESHNDAFALAGVTAGAGGHTHEYVQSLHPHGWSGNGRAQAVQSFVQKQRPSLVLATMYALGHGSVVFVLGILALTLNEFLPSWIDPIMQRIVGVTLLLLAAYLFYSVYQFFRGGEEFRIRSRWMIVFAGVRNVFERARARVLGQPREHVHEAQQYGLKTAYGIGMIHGVGAETGTQVLVITTAVGAGSKTMGVIALTAFIVGLLISNSIVAVVTTVGFVSSRQRQGIYVAAGLFAAVFSLFVGLYFVLQSSDALPNLDQYFHWIGGGNVN